VTWTLAIRDPIEKRVEGGVVGIIIDARGRPLALPEDDTERRRKLVDWMIALDMYPKAYLEKIEI
jgi:hypothetical protein